MFWLIIAAVATAFFFAGEKREERKISSQPQVKGTSDDSASSDTSVASRKISSAGNESKGSRSIPFSPMIPSARVNDMVVDSRGTLWLATEKGLSSVINGQITDMSEDAGTFPAPQAECIAFDGQKIWVGTLFGLYSIARSGRTERHSVIDSPGGEMILDLTFDGMTLWVGTHAGSAFLDKDGKFVVLDSRVTNGGLRDDWCTNIMRFSGWFVATHDKGISFWNTGFKASNPEFWKNIDTAKSGIIRPITGLAFEGNHVWVDTSRGVLFLTTPLEKLFSESVSNFINYTTVHGLPSNRINAILSHRGAVWLGTSSGLARISKEKIEVVSPVDGTNPGSILALVASGDILWLGTAKGVQFINAAMVD